MGFFHYAISRWNLQAGFRHRMPGQGPWNQAGAPAANLQILLAIPACSPSARRELVSADCSLLRANTCRGLPARRTVIVAAAVRKYGVWRSTVCSVAGTRFNRPGQLFNMARCNLRMMLLSNLRFIFSGKRPVFQRIVAPRIHAVASPCPYQQRRKEVLRSRSRFSTSQTSDFERCTRLASSFRDRRRSSPKVMPPGNPAAAR